MRKFKAGDCVAVSLWANYELRPWVKEHLLDKKFRLSILKRIAHRVHKIVGVNGEKLKVKVLSNNPSIKEDKLLNEFKYYGIEPEYEIHEDCCKRI